MSLVVLSSTALPPASITSIRDSLGITERPDTRLAVVSWRRSGSPLPVDLHLLVRTSTIVTGSAAHGPTSTAAAAHTSQRSNEVAAASSNPTRAADRSIHDPVRLRAAARWRARRVLKLTTRLGLPDPRAIALRFALACMRSGEVVGLVSRADIVVVLDRHSQLSGWLLARRVPGPRVVAGTAAAARELAIVDT